MKEDTADDRGNRIIFIYAALTKDKEQVLGETTRQQASTVVSKMIRKPVEEVPPSYLEIEDGDFFLDIEKDEFERLEVLAEKNEIAFFTYKGKLQY